jgi:putative Mg2+ transporter-C (MgtC) family protein
VLLGALIGVERQSFGKPAGLRTHMLVALGAALFVIAPREAGLRGSEIASVVQGVAAGIGFIGAGTILKLADREQIKGLTTAASIWMTAAIGIAAGLGPLWVPVLAAACAWIILYVFARIESRRSPDRG